MDFLEQLNPAQREAVVYDEGPQLVIAGAGSGKTRVLTYKIAYLLRQGVRANNILALTFTNKAAREMKERICALVPPEHARYLWMGTFHSICAKILRQEAAKLGYTRDFSIYDTADSKSVVKQICKEKQLDDKVYKPNVVLAKISAAKNSLINADEYARRADLAKQDRFDRLYDMPDVYRLYEARLKGANAMDFDDLLMQICLLFRRDEEALAYYQNMFKYVLVDEYQDTNYAQYLIVKLLAEPQNNVCVVGDDAQSIYSFRGADIRNILTFQQGYPNARLFKLERNYRSTQTIVNAANSLIHKNEHQIYKEVFSEKEVGDRIRLYAFMSDRDEATGTASMVREDKLRHKSITYDDIAVLYRTNAQSRSLENELRRANIPYRIYGGTSFYQRKEIKDAISYFRLAANPKDNEALLRVINFPARGIGDVTLRKVSEQAALMNLSMFEVIADPAAAQLSISPATAKRLIQFAQMMQRFALALEEKNAYELAELVMRESGIMTAAVMDRTPEGIDRKENLDELLAGIHEFVDQRTEEGVDFTPIQDFLAEVSLLTDQDENLQDHTARVTLMTVHAAKGLEFHTVHIVGLEEQLFPSRFCTAPAEIEEERRLLYVAITRAMQYCTLSYARQRFINGSVEFASASRFLKDIDRQYLELVQPASPKPERPMWTQNTWAKPNLPTGGITVQTTANQAAKPLKPMQTSASAPNCDHSPGDRVKHRVFGSGVIQRIYRDEATGNDKIDILFDEKGQKTLLLAYAKLERE
ncbi:MAG: UvrD-helicase domain-containing protein [Paludibacteraceae bacterium]|nr:UvrD-helicase domain-containing protein [Paludibacteraceae bacterium]